jgi:hypothetical protein
MPLKFDAFPKSEPGDNGLNNASMLTFEGEDLNAFVKEMTQNSIDALQDGQTKLKIRIRLEEIETSAIPEYESLNKILDQMIEYWREQKQVQFMKRFREAKNKLKNYEGKTFVLVFEDFHTKGLTGGITNGSFKSLLLDEGVQGDKPVNGALGGFGIGKNAMFNLSPLQTVFYTSYNREGYKFMGVTKLAEYKDDNGTRKSNRIYYGSWDTQNPNAYNLNLINDVSEIPEIFKRTEFGLSSFAIGVKDLEGWEILVKKALVKNYWYRFLNDGIEAEIIKDGEVMFLNQTNFTKELKNLFTGDDEDKSVMAFIKAYSEPQETDGKYYKNIDIANFGEIKIHLREQDSDELEYPDKVLYIRDGMMIMQEPKYAGGGLPKKIAGVIFCESIEGNKILSKMEPPAHDSFKPSLLPKQTENLTEKVGQDILQQIRSAKREAINKLKEKYTTSSKSAEVVDDILSGFSDSVSTGNGSGNNKVSEVEEFYRRKTQKQINPNNSGNNDVIAVINQPDAGGDSGGKEGGSGGGRPGEGQREGKSGQGPGTGTGSGGSGQSGGDKGRRKTLKRKDADISATIFFKERSGENNIYFLIVRTGKDLKGTHLSFSQFGDEGGSSPTSELIKVCDEADRLYQHSLDRNIFTINDLDLNAGIPNILQLEFKETVKSAFKFINR